MKGILADINVVGQVEYLVSQMQSASWLDVWQSLGISLVRFEEIGLTETSTDFDIWRRCQEVQLVLITDNRNHESPDSLEATLRVHNTPTSLPVFTIGDLTKFSANRSYCDRVVEALLDYLLRIDSVRGTGRLYLP